MTPSVREPVVHNGVRLDEKDRITDAPVSGFTAVNGRASPQTLKLSGNGTERRPSRADASSPDGDRPQDRRQVAHHHPEHPDRPPSPLPLERDRRLASPGKRKRSLSDDDDEELGVYSRHPHGAPVREQRDSSSLESSDSEDDEVLDNDSGDAPTQSKDFGGPSQAQSYGLDGEGAKDRAWYDRQRVDPSGSGGQYADVLQREPRSIDGTPREGNHVEGGALVHANNDYGSTTEITRAGVQVDPKKRKRMFSNRTKTGCQTCRRRKKKCDEGKPECNNCIRGGFVCEGYLSKSTWTKPGMSKGHVPLQSKHGYHEHPGIYPRPAGDPFPDTRPPQPIEGGRTRPIVVDDEQSRANARNPWAAWHPPQERVVNNEYSRTAPPSEPLRRHDYGEHVGYTHGQSAPPHLMAPAVHQPQHLSTSQSAMTAQLALQQTLPQQPPQQTPQQPPQQPPPQQGLSDKEKMLAGDYFFPFSPQLVEEREQCTAALWRFNNATNPSFGGSREERTRLFRAILEPQQPRLPRGGHCPVGSLGKGVIIEAPFRCDYGYNIVIGDDVVIGANCTILDARRVRIGPRSILGPNVQIFTVDYSTNPRDRKGSKGAAYAREVTIEEEVYIGGGVTILPGATIRKGSTIGAGSVVTKDTVPRMTLAVGSPATVKAGIWPETNYSQQPRR